MNKKVLLLLLPFAVGTLAGCEPANPNPPVDQCDQAQVTLNKTTATLKVGESVELVATAPEACGDLGWGVDQAGESVVSLQKDGKTCTVTATSVGTAIVGYGTTASCTITVTDEPGPGPVTPVHDGTLEDPFDNADAMLVANSLEPGEATEEEYYIKGKVAGFEEDFSPSYGNYSFSIEGGFICWRLKNGPEYEKFEEGDIEIGDEVVVFAKIQKFHKDGQPDKPETKDGYVHSVKKDGPQEPSLKLDKTEASLKIGKTVTITATVKNTEEEVAWSIEGTAASMEVSADKKSVTLTGVSVGSATVKAKLAVADLEESCVVAVSEPAPVGQGAVYTFVNDKTSAQNWSTIGEDGFKKATVCEGDEIIIGYKDGENAYIGGNGGSGDTAWNIWNCLKVGKSGSQGKITIKLDSDLSFESIKISAIGARDDGTLVVNGISKDVTKKATKDDLEPMVLEYDIGGGISELTLTSKPNPGSKENFGICITRIEFVGRQEAVLESISADITKKSYEVGDELSLDGLTVTGHYSDGNDAPITEGITTSLAAGHIMSLEDTSLTVYVGEIHTDIELTVTDPTLVLDYIAMSGVKETYYAGQKLGAITVKAYYIGGTEIDVSNQAVLKIGDTVVDADHIMAIGETSVVASFEDETDVLTFTVVEDTVAELTVATDSHREFNVGAEFVPEKINASYVSGKVEEDVNATFDGYDMNNASEQTVTVEFGGASTTYGITVSEVTPIVKEGTYLINVTVESVTYYMQANGASAPKAVTNPDDATQFIFSLVSETNDHYHIKTADGDYLYSLADNNGIRVGKTEFVWIIEEGEATLSGAFNLKQNSALKDGETARYLSLYNTQDFRCYNSATAGNRKANTDLEECVVKTLDSISVTSGPTKNTYYVGESLQTEGLVVKGHYVWDGGSEDKEITGYELSQAGAFVEEDIGEKTITVSYNGKTTSFVVTVQERTATLSSVTISGTAQSEYSVGDKYNHNGLTATANYSDGGTLDVSDLAEWTISKETAEKDDTSITITAEYQGVSGTKDVDVTVTEPSTEGRTVETAIKKIGGFTETSYVGAKTVEIDKLNFSLARFNPSNGQIRGNKTGLTDTKSTASDKAFQFANIDKIDEKITSIELVTKMEDLSSNHWKTDCSADVLTFAYGSEACLADETNAANFTSKITLRPSDGGRIVIDTSEISFKYFKLFNTNTFTTGNVTDCYIVINYNGGATKSIIK